MALSHARHAARLTATMMGSAAARLAYRRRELAVVALLAASLIGGSVVETWHQRAPEGLDRLEAEPPRLAAVAPRAPLERRLSRGQPRDRAPAPPEPAAPSPPTPLDLNRATAADLARLPGVGPRLVERILARREALGGRFGSADDLTTVPGIGPRKVGRLRSLVTVSTEGATVSTEGAEVAPPLAAVIASPPPAGAQGHAPITEAPP